MLLSFQGIHYFKLQVHQTWLTFPLNKKKNHYWKQELHYIVRLIFTISFAPYSFLLINIPIWYHFISSWRSSCCISCSIGLLAINSFSFILSETVSILPSILKYLFVVQRILDWQFSVYNFSILISCLFIFVVSDEKLAVVWIIVLLYVMCFFSSCC